jgi:hypothetical protein
MTNLFRKRVFVVAVALALAPACSWAASDALAFSQRQQERAGISGDLSFIAQADAHLRAFALGVEKYVYANDGQVPWNTADTSAPISYSPFLVYAAGSTISASAAQSDCGFTYGWATPPGFSAPINLVSAANITPSMSVTWAAPSEYLPSNWSVPLGGVDCAAVWINQPSAQQITIHVFYVPPVGAVSGNLTAAQITYGMATNAAAKAAISGSSMVWYSGLTGAVWK